MLSALFTFLSVAVLIAAAVGGVLYWVNVRRKVQANVASGAERPTRSVASRVAVVAIGVGVIALSFWLRSGHA
jgi:hypothetical protein